MLKIGIHDPDCIALHGLESLLMLRFPEAQITKFELLSNRSWKSPGYDVIITVTDVPADTIQYILGTAAAPKVIVLTRTEHLDEAIRYFSLGVSGYISKEESVETILTAIESVIVEEQRYISKTILEKIAEFFISKTNRRSPEALTYREKQIAQLMIQGKRVQEICQILRLQPSTVSTHKNRVFKKTGTANIIELKAKLDTKESLIPSMLEDSGY